MAESRGRNLSPPLFCSEEAKVDSETLVHAIVEMFIMMYGLDCIVREVQLAHPKNA